MVIVRVSILIILLMLCACWMPPMRTVASQYESVVIIQTPCSTGSGVVIDRTHVLTAAHVVKCASGIHVKFDNHVFNGSVVYTDKKYDQAMLLVDKLTFPNALTPMPPGLDSVSVGDRVCIITAWPNHARWCGKVLSTEPEFKFSGKIVPGNSGSPMYNSKGYLVGIVTKMDLLFDVGYGEFVR